MNVEISEIGLFCLQLASNFHPDYILLNNFNFDCTKNIALKSLPNCSVTHIKLTDLEIKRNHFEKDMGSRPDRPKV